MKLSDLRKAIPKTTLERKFNARARDARSTDPYWGRRFDPTVPSSPFTQSLRSAAERNGQRVTPAAAAVARQSCGKCGLLNQHCSKMCLCKCHEVKPIKEVKPLNPPRVAPEALWPNPPTRPSGASMIEFFKAVDEAAERHRFAGNCCYCGAEGVDEAGACAYCSQLILSQSNVPEVVHTAGEKLEVAVKAVPPHIFIVDDQGVIKEHATSTDSNGRTTVEISGKEIEI